MITVPAKVWRPKPKDRFLDIDYATEYDDSVFIFEKYGRAITTLPMAINVATRQDIRMWNSNHDDEEFTKNFNIGSSVNPTTTQQLQHIVQKYWDCFYADGVKFPVLHFEFTVDTGTSKPVCCPQPRYGIFERVIMQEQLDTLIHNDWIEPASGPWGSMIVLAPKPHQDEVTNISDFVWRMCISYRKLNAITLPFEYPIPRCDDAIDDFGEGHGRLYFISLDARSGYHQISVHPADRCKLAFFGPDGKKYTFKVMPFGPRNAPPVYTAMMRQLDDEWEALFDFRFPKAKPRGCRVIVDDILLWSSHTQELLGYLECVLSICLKYRLSLKLSKCDFLKDRIEYVGHDLTPNGNCPAESKYPLINDWPTPTTIKSLHSFICLCNFYSRYCPWFEVNLKPFRTLVRETPNTSAIPVAFWDSNTTSLFTSLKQDITSSPCLARFDRHKPIFLKTDYSALGMALALMQPDDSKESRAATASLVEDQEYDFDATMKGARLRPIKFHSRRCLEREQHYHSFVGEAATGRWAIGICRKYLVGQHFFWLCDCSAMKEILEYTGNIHQVRRWSQELLGYHFTILHRPARMMQDVDALSRFYDPLIDSYNITASQLRRDDCTQRPTPTANLCSQPSRLMC